MPHSRSRLSVRPLALLAAVIALAPAALAAVVPKDGTRFDRVVLPEPSAQVGVIAESPESLPGFDTERAGWSAFRSALGGSWQVAIDRRSGSPILVQGDGIPWFDPSTEAPSLATLEGKARSFLGAHEVLFKVRGSQLAFNVEGSAITEPGRAVLIFNRVVDGIPVEGNRVVLYVVAGRLVSFGADRWGALDKAPEAKYGEATARQVLYTYMGIVPSDVVTESEAARLELMSVLPEGGPNRYEGMTGAGNAYRPVWRFAFRVAGTTGGWVGKVDAITGTVVALYDNDKYAAVRGGIFTRSNDGLCPDGCEQPGFPLPWANLLNAVETTAGDMGQYTCTGSSSVQTTLNGPYFKIVDSCGVVSDAATCDDDLDMGVTPNRLNCGIQPGESPGNTGPSRTCFYQTNRIKEKLRYWLPSNTWGTIQTTINTNVNSTCNATWGGNTLNMYKEGGGCRNTGEIAGVVDHELGHGIDENDGGGFDDPTEAYADITSIIQVHRSCVGRGFFESGVCSGYGDTCLSCTGIRDMDWAQRQANTPATPANFTSSHCGGGSGPCGKEEHCEAYPPGETIYDLATRDLPAAGFDQATSWQIVERIWYKSRQGSGGNAFNCALPNSDGCNAGGWFNSMRVADDDDGNLANGTPHGAAIYAAFNRHKLACGNVGDASNQSTGACPALAKPVVTATSGSSSASLSWGAVANAANYLVLRTEAECDFSSNVIATIPAGTLSYTDTDLINDLPMYYKVQAQGSNPACNSPVSDCKTVTPQPFAGSIKLDQSTYACSSTLQISVRDANIGASTTTATIFSGIEPTPETVVLTETTPGSTRYVGTIPLTAGPAVAGNGVLSVANGTTITARYIDADDGLGGVNLVRETTALGDCVQPIVTQVSASGISDVQGTVTWATNENSTSIVHFGQVKPPSTTRSSGGTPTSHAVLLTGLQACTVYWYSVESQDAAGNVVVDDNAGQYYHFETLGDLGSGLQSCHGGKVTLSKSTVACSDTLPIKVTDLDVNLSPTLAETVQVTVTSSTEIAPETVTLTETGPNTSQFTGSIGTASGAPAADGILQVASGDIVSVTYQDADDGTGTITASSASASVDCAGASSNLVEVVNITDETAQIHWTTNEPTTGRVDWGTTPALGSFVNLVGLVTDHTVTLGPVAECAKYYFRVTTTDAYGNVSVLDLGGAPFSFNATRIPAGIFNDGFETLTGWTLQGDWQIAAPQGLGASPADPSSAFQGTKVLGQDLTGLGSSPGNYEVNTTFKASSPVINASTLSGGLLRFRRKLSTADGGISTITIVRNGHPFDVWSSSSTNDTGWTSQSINVSQYTDGSSSMTIEFRQKAGTSIPHSGWNIDRLSLNSASQPSFEACGGCQNAPAFGGLVSAVDINACNDTGIQLSWNAATAWGTSGSGSYVVYRDTTPNFVPSAANRIAVSVAGTSYTDLSAPNGVTLYYLVRAESAETCGGGPGNGGVVDTNNQYRSAVDAISQPAPGAVATINVAGINDAQVRLTWSAAPNAASYIVYRASSPQGPFPEVAYPTGTLYEDRDQFESTTSWYYKVRAVDACGNVGP